jgi:hypothetical protein
MKAYVYAHRTLDTNELFYVGKGTGTRLTSKKNRNKHWRHIVGAHGFKAEILVSDLTDEQALAAEIKLIAQLNPKANYILGGDSGNTFAKKTKDEIKAIMSKRRINKEGLASYGFKGKTHSKETKKKITGRPKKQPTLNLI